VTDPLLSFCRTFSPVIAPSSLHCPRPLCNPSLSTATACLRECPWPCLAPPFSLALRCCLLLIALALLFLFPLRTICTTPIVVFTLPLLSLLLSLPLPMLHVRCRSLHVLAARSCLPACLPACQPASKAD